MSICLCKTFNFDGDPIDVLEIFKDDSYVFFLDSNLHHNSYGRYSFMGFNPFNVFYAEGEDALSRLRERAQIFFEKPSQNLTPFPAGMVGFLSYDLGLSFENIKTFKDDDLMIPGCVFAFYDVVLTFDHFLKKLHVTSTGLPERREELRRKRAQKSLDDVMTRFSHLDTHSHQQPRSKLYMDHADLCDVKLQSNFTKEEYCQAATKALEYIKEGEIYQVNLSQRFSCDLWDYGRRVDPLDIYKSLRNVSPSSFSAFFQGKDFQIISSSPERFLHVHDRIVQTRPMKGTRARGRSSWDDQKEKDDLIQSSKDTAELLMITDLERNDLGRVCDFGSIKVQEMRTIEEYNTVFQATSTIEGHLREDKDNFDLLRTCFPGGSITGCPKIRSMNIIEELEPSRRSIYTGSLGYISFNGDMDFNILIRTMLVAGQKIYFHVGGGIVSDSTPENEYHETLVKAKAMRSCLSHVLQDQQTEKLRV